MLCTDDVMDGDLGLRDGDTFPHVLVNLNPFCCFSCTSCVFYPSHLTTRSLPLTDEELFYKCLYFIIQTFATLTFILTSLDNQCCTMTCIMLYSEDLVKFSRQINGLIITMHFHDVLYWKNTVSKNNSVWKKFLTFHTKWRVNTHALPLGQRNRCGDLNPFCCSPTSGL